MIDKENFWASNYYGHPPLTDSILKAAETQLGVRLPTGLVELLKVQNGGYTKGFVFPMAQRTTWAENHVPLSELFGIVLDKSIKTAQNLMDSQHLIKEWGLPPNQILINGDGDWWITLDYRSGDEQVVMWFDVERNEEVKVADDFNAFLNGLVPDDIFT